MPVLQDTAGRSRPVNYIVKLTITGLLLFLIIRNVDSRQVLHALSRISLLSLVLALIAQVASNCVAAFRWFLIMSKIGFDEPFAFYLKSFFKGTFFNQGLPTSIGGDGIRILDCSQVKGRTEDAFYGVVIDRVMGLTGLLILNISAMLFNRTLLPANIYFPLLFFLTLLFLSIVFLFFLRRLRLFAGDRFLGYIGRLSERYVQVYSSVSSISLQTGLSVLTHLFSMIAFFILGRGVGLDYPLPVYLVLVPPVILLTILPISLAGWGLREGAMVGFFLLIGAEKASVLSFSILYGILVLVASIPGLIVFLAQKKSL
ncbi:MAG: UPF0104 family protein [Desulfobulbaceae bacterium]|nr:UPF0104 family protein [Desulfobulbaceae bacterium]